REQAFFLASFRRFADRNRRLFYATAEEQRRAVHLSTLGLHAIRRQRRSGIVTALDTAQKASSVPGPKSA
ncbi:hypothetical protein, partial [Paraburkholderia rhynchosiae]